MVNEIKIEKSFYAIIPANVRYNKNIPSGGKLLYGEITALCNEKGFCWASNKYFSDLYDNDDRTIRRWIRSLEKEEFIYIIIKGKSRQIFLSHKIKIDVTEVENTSIVENDVSEEEIQSGEKPKKEKKITIKKSEQKYDFSVEDLRLAEMLYSKILINFPYLENKKVVIQEWADDIRKLRLIDKATIEQISFMINWVQGGEVNIPNKPNKKFEPNEFWSKNILSAKKLRKQWFENLVPQLQASIKKDVKNNTVGKL